MNQVTQTASQDFYGRLMALLESPEWIITAYGCGGDYVTNETITLTKGDITVMVSVVRPKEGKGL